MIFIVTRRMKTILALVALYLSVAGLVTFSLFILEESIQMATFGSWPAADSKDWATVKAACGRIRAINQTLKIINYSLGWIQPIAFVSYRHYGQATDIYIQGLRSKVFANAPELFDNETVAFTFTPQIIADAYDGFHHINGKLVFVSASRHPRGIRFQARGRVVITGSMVRVTETR
jgi:hypothetical protein